MHLTKEKMAQHKKLLQIYNECINFFTDPILEIVFNNLNVNYWKKLIECIFSPTIFYYEPS